MSNLFITNLIKFCSYASFIEKYRMIEIDSPKWEEYISQLNLTMKYLQSLRGDEFEEQIKFIDEQIIETEEAFKNKMEILCTHTVTIIETNIVLEAESISTEDKDK